MPTSPRLSVVITTYKRDDYLEQCLHSLAEQTRPLHEIVVVDDGGSGSAKDVVARFDARFRYAWQPNGGVQKARNHGVRMATGEWLAFLDDDDLWTPHRHEHLAEVIATGEADIISGDFVKFKQGQMAPTSVYEEIRRLSPRFWDGIERSPGRNYTVVGRFPLTRLAPVYPFWPSTLAVERGFLARINGWNERVRGILGEDIEFAFRALKHGRFAVLWPVTLKYRTHPGNRVGDTLNTALGRAKIWEIVLRDLDLESDEVASLQRALGITAHEALWEAFGRRRYKAVLSIARSGHLSDTSVQEKCKILVSRLLAHWDTTS